ncbi:4-phosphoerythronate dehydrogenase PdxB [Parabacteroides distasonis]|mgnify:CR=1 FL=1|uniref:Erythronate-4-phosphate dehydrogenase n=1 Tax=Parabacteroides distasonis TaxID=823 RepID=A0A3L7ZRD8_PARDI|nr:4-phosphoerythronate dehydrogenase PdxB [Parabacteroides distasonis]NBH90111.1 4-phosphoerythronate dehydrogenase PdxB [Parabacteroides distasonis]RLT72610.1 4-phosphoerythronate dehydrogenase PdxB [Parabacteroides distasonis]TGY60908.1 4-phosphoerythronate dehydrogenase PdxB [Parabacteroides distasonis]
MKIIADNTVPYLKGILEPIADVSYLDSKEFTPTNIKDADALVVRSIDKCTRELLEGSRVRLITTATIGYDHIDTRYCEKAGITWKNAPGCNAASVGQYVLSSLVAVALRKGERLAGKTIGIVGVGHVGSIVERLCETVGMRVLRNDPPRAEQEGEDGFVSLDTIAKEADIITLHVPLTKEGRFATRHLADHAFFDKLERNPWFINSCRGAVHDTQALLQAKRTGKVSELIIDCWENEPDIDRKLLSEATIATPHIAGFSADGKANGTRMCLEHIKRFFGIKIDKIKEVVPSAPFDPVIELGQFAMNRVEETILRSFNPQTIDRKLRESPERFEWFRAHYDHPREFHAYHIIGSSPEEDITLKRLGFQIA